MDRDTTDGIESKMRLYEIAPAQEGKGRTFRAMCLATIEADSLWQGGGADDRRPVWSMFIGSENELRPFAVNLQLGRKAQFVSNTHSSKRDHRIELLKSARFALSFQREAEGSIATAYLPDLFRLDPGMVDPTGARFVLAPTAAWVASQKVDPKPLVEHALRLPYADKIEPELLPTLAPMAYLFAAYLDRRTRLPLLADGRFYLQLLLACLDQGCASFADKASDRGYNGYAYDRRAWGYNRGLRFFAEGVEDVGLAPPIAFGADHKAFGELLAEQVAVFFDMTKGH